MKTIIFIGWIFIPLIIAILGFADPMIGAILLIISIFKIAVTAIKHFGNPNKWIPGYSEKMAKKRAMEHYYHHCEKNPKAFNKLRDENFRMEE